MNVQIARSDDFSSWDLLSETDALPGPFPDWVGSKPNTWAPDVIQRVRVTKASLKHLSNATHQADGKYVMYFSATSSKDSSKHCVGAATSSSITGSYKPEDGPIACPLDKGGAIDPDGYRDDGDLYVVYKVDGNSLNKHGKTHPTPIMLQAMKDDGVTPDGDPVQLLDRSEADGPLIEAPSLKKSDDTYFLTFSSNMYDTTKYDVSYATASGIKGPYTKADEPLLVSGDPSSVGSLAGPGGADFSANESKIVFHAFGNGHNIKDGRAMFTSEISFSGDIISIV